MKNITAWVKSHKYCLAGLYALVFLAGFGILELVEPEPKYYLHSALDDLIPFNEYFVIPYFIWYAWIPLVFIYFMRKDGDSDLRYNFLIFAGGTVCLFIYAIWPNGLQLREEITSTNICAWIVKTIRSIDPPCNVCPSIHVSSTVAAHMVIIRYRGFQHNRLIKTVSWILVFLIPAGTLFIKQHSVIDVFWGVVLTLVMALIWEIITRSSAARRSAA
ncbi:MAG: hypothetical protein LUC90_06175 [Lachnospiraceae bacterium]|nr:hypothetical protein [Lachnospiraceae bacterium]